jgi:L-arabinokinase
VLAAYVSAHGFGHLTRTCEVLAAVRARAPGLKITLMTGAPPMAAQRIAPPGVALRPLAADVGVAQADALTIDEPATVERWRAFDGRFGALVAEEAAFLRDAGARAVLGDVPPLAFAAAAAAGVRALGLANFSWDWIYRHLAQRQPGLALAAERAAAAYASADLLLELPFAGDLAAFPRRERIGMVARCPRLPAGEARRRLGLEGETRPIALVAFGGFPLAGLGSQTYGRDAAVRWLLPEELSETRLASLGLDYPDLMGAADVVVSKPGYGTVTDAIAARTRLVYTDRGDFPEYPVMVVEMPRYLPSVYVSHAELRDATALSSAVEKVLALPWPEAPDLKGAERAAARVLERLG